MKNMLDCKMLTNRDVSVLNIVIHIDTYKSIGNITDRYARTLTQAHTYTYSISRADRRCRIEIKYRHIQHLLDYSVEINTENTFNFYDKITAMASTCSYSEALTEYVHMRLSILNIFNRFIVSYIIFVAYFYRVDEAAGAAME